LKQVWISEVYYGLTMKFVVRLKAADDVKLAGGKGSSLARMITAGFRVPDGFVIIAAAKTMDDELKDEIFAAFDQLGAEKVAVRSSALAEDGTKDAWAGQMDTFLNVGRNGLIEAVQKCWRSAGSQRAKAYAEEKGLDAGCLAVVVQEMIDGDVSGVAFSVHPVTNNKNQVIIEAVKGLADKLVSGEITPDSYVADKRTNEIISQAAQNSNALLNQAQLSELSETAAKLEEYFGFPVDVEWTFANGQLFILQSRPITTLG
jgi:rifampicin phosphotransferase